MLCLSCVLRCCVIGAGCRSPAHTAMLMLRACTHLPHCRTAVSALQTAPRTQIRQRRRVLTSAAVSNGTPEKLQFWNITPAPGSCPFAQRAWIALEELEVPYDVRLVDKANKTEEFAELFKSIWPDPEKTSTVPIIVDTDGTKVTESAITVEYLDAKHGPKLVPKDPAQAAKARLFSEVFSTSLTKPAFTLYGASTPAELVDAKRALARGMQVLDQFLQIQGTPEGPFLLGTTYSIAEVNTASFLSSLAILLPAFRQVDLLHQAKELGLDRLAGWIQARLAVLDRPSTGATSLPKEVRLEYGKARIAEVKS